MTERLFHFSEEPDIKISHPRKAVTNPDPDIPLYVWAIEERLQHNFWFPRDCPRVTFFATEKTSDHDRERFFAHTTAKYILAIESGWLERMRATAIHAYELPTETFEPWKRASGAAYHVSSADVEPLEVTAIPDLVGALADRGVELRVMPSLWPLRNAVTQSTLQFSISRFRNAAAEAAH